jgi:prepilin-type N-terminal cleavage/methylation domain-containing protein
MTRTARKGFTLIELLIVVVIIGILAAIAIPKFANTKSKAYIAAMKSDLRNLVTAEESYFSDSAKYATDTLAGMKFKPSTGVGMPTIAVGSGYWTATNTHTQLAATFNCMIAVNTANTVVTTAGDGEPACK